MVQDLYAPKADEASRIITVILLDYAAESMLKTVLSSVPSRKVKIAKEPSFPDVWRAIDSLSGQVPVPFKPEILSLHRLRNLTQHANTKPSREDVANHTGYVGAFLRRLYLQFFDLDFDVLSLTTLVENEVLRQHLERAEAHLAAHAQRDAVEEAAKALYKAAWMAANLIGVSQAARDWRDVLDLRWAGFSDEQQRALQGILDRIDRLAEQVESALWPLVSGIDWTAHMRYRALVPSVFATFGKPINVTHTQEDYSDDEAKALFQYTLEQILRLQDMGALVIPLPEELSQV